MEGVLSVLRLARGQQSGASALQPGSVGVNIGSEHAVQARAADLLSIERTIASLKVSLPFSADQYDLNVEDRAKVEVCNLALDRLRSAQVPQVGADQCEGSASWAFSCLRQLKLRRVLSLADGAGDEWNKLRLLNSAILLRSLIETVAGFYYVVHRGERLLKEGDLRRLHNETLKAMYGTRQDGSTQLPSANHVLKTIDCLDKWLQGARRHYDALSELLHPNAPGLSVFGDLSHEEFVLYLEMPGKAQDFLLRQIIAGLVPMEAVAYVFCDSAQQFVEGIEALEQRHGRSPGEWPSG